MNIYDTRLVFYYSITAVVLQGHYSIVIGTTFINYSRLSTALHFHYLSLRHVLCHYQMISIYLKILMSLINNITFISYADWSHKYVIRKTAYPI